MNVRRLAIGAAVGLSVLVAACGGSGGSPTTGGPYAPPTAAGGASPAAPSATADAGASGGGAGGATGAPVAAGGDYCGLLRPGDFAAAGIQGAGAPTANPDPAGAYCVYAGVSGATGGIELDVFVGFDAADASSIFVNVRSFVDLGTGKAALPEADEVAILPAGGGSPGYAAIAVRKGLLVFGISCPSGDGAADALVALARLVIQRGSALAG